MVATCKQQIRAAADAVITCAQQAGAIRPDVKSTDLLHLVHGIVQVTQQTPEGLEQAEWLITTVMAGIHAPER